MLHQIYQYLPDGTPLPAAYARENGVVYGDMGVKCCHCDATGTRFHMRHGYIDCQACGGTGRVFGAIYKIEE